MYASESQWKQILGKKISESAYISHLQLREVFKNAMHSIRFNGDIVRKRVNDLEERLKEKDALIKQLEEKLAKTNEGMSKMSMSLEDLTARVEAIEIKKPEKVKID
jgi:uncharacterized coiled-coil protein SlyX